MTEGTESQPRIRAGWLLRQSIRETIANWRGLLAVSLLPLGGHFLGGLLSFIPFESLPDEGLMKWVMAGGMLAGGLAIVISIIFGPFSFWVGWQRVLLLGPHSIFRPLHFRFWGREFFTLLYTLLIQLLVALVFLPLLALGGMAMGAIVSMGNHEGPPQDISSYYWGLMALIFLFVLLSAALWARWSFVFPAIAVDAPCGIRRSWRWSKGVGKPLFLVWGLLLIILMLPAILTISFQIKALEKMASENAVTGLSLNLMWGGDAIGWLLLYPIMAVMVAALAIVYRETVGLPADKTES